MTDPHAEKPESEHPQGDEFPLEMQPEFVGEPAAGDDFPMESLSMSASIEDFHFSGPAEELDFTEPADFTFPTEEAVEGEVVSEHTGDFAAAESVEGEHFFGGEETTFTEPQLADEVVAEPELAGEGIADQEVAEEEAPKRKFELPQWVRTLEWVTIVLLGVGSLLALIISIFYIDNNPKQVTLTLNIACPLMLALIPYALWRSKNRWVRLPVTATYTIILALSTAVMIAGTWCEGIELSRYDWQFTKARVAAGKPRRVIIAPIDAVEPAPAKEPEPAANPVPAANPTPAKDSAVPAAAK